MAHGRPRHHVPERDRPRHRRNPSGSALHRGGTRALVGIVHHARARGPHRRGDRAVAATEGADLRHAVHGRHAAAEARRVRRQAASSRSQVCRSTDASMSVHSISRWSTLAHSIPEPSALAIRTPLGLVFHTGDWKLDNEPLVGRPPDEATPAALGEEGVLALVCDSTNAFREGRSPSETDVATLARRYHQEAPSAASPSRRSPPTWRASKRWPTRRVPPGASWWSRAGRCTGSSTSP